MGLHLRNLVSNGNRLHRRRGLNLKGAAIEGGTMRVARGWRSLGRAFGLWVAWSGLVLLGSGQAASGAKPAAKATEGAGVKLDFLDPMIREAWDQASIKPSRPASDEEFLRRAYL